MKFMPAITNSSNFYGLVWYHPTKMLPLNEAALVACALLGVESGMVSIRTDSRQDLILFHRDVRSAGEIPPPVLIRSLRRARGGNIADTGPGEYTATVEALALLSGFSWVNGDAIIGEDNRGEKWKAILEWVEIEYAPRHWYTGWSVALYLSDHRRYNWSALTKKLMELVPSPDSLPEAVALWQENKRHDTPVLCFYKDVLLIDNFCLWQFGDVVCGISPMERQGTEQEDMESICYGARLLSALPREQGIHFLSSDMPFV